jgi:SAM-dependent methyltransferase
MPLADEMPWPHELENGRPQRRYPLRVAFCPACSLVQIRDTVPPEVLFGEDYPYFSSYSNGVVRNAEEIAARMVRLRKLGSESLVVEPASNDGYLLKHYARVGVPVLGIDPVPGLVAAAEKQGVRSLKAFFGADLARTLRREGQAADVIHANNVLAHQADLNGFVEGISTLLKDDGVAVIEAPYVRDLIEKCEFDTIYHEHHCYFSVMALDNLFRRHGLYVNEVERIPIHGGSLRVFVGKTDAPSESVTRLLAKERELGMDLYGYYQDFSWKVQEVKRSLADLLESLKAEGCRIAAYGAAAKGTTLINYVGIGPNVLDFVVDRNPHKHGRLMPGQHIPIKDTSALLDEKPDYLLLLAWNYKDEIMKQQRAYAEQGGKLIVPIPSPTIV